MHMMIDILLLPRVHSINDELINELTEWSS